MEVYVMLEPILSIITTRGNGGDWYGKKSLCIDGGGTGGAKNIFPDISLDEEDKVLAPDASGNKDWRVQSEI
jgi:hypothetical protein